MQTKLGGNSPIVLTFYTEIEQNLKGIQAGVVGKQQVISDLDKSRLSVEERTNSKSYKNVTVVHKKTKNRVSGNYFSKTLDENGSFKMTLK